MIKTIENDMNKVLLKTDILLEAVCDYYDIDIYYCESTNAFYETSNSFVEKTKSIFKSMIEAVKKFTKNLIEAIKAKVSDTSFKIKYNKLQKEINNGDIKFNYINVNTYSTKSPILSPTRRYYRFKSIDESIQMIQKMCDDGMKIISTINNKEFKNKEEFENYSYKLFNSWEKKYNIILKDLESTEIYFKIDKFDVKKLDVYANNICKSNTTYLNKIDDFIEIIIKNIEDSIHNTDDILITSKTVLYKEISNKIINGCNKIKKGITKHPFIILKIVKDSYDKIKNKRPADRFLHNHPIVNGIVSETIDGLIFEILIQ